MLLHHAIQLPLPIDLAPSAQRKSVEPLVAAQITENGLDRRKALPDPSPAGWAIDACLYLLDPVSPPSRRPGRRNLTGDRLLWRAAVERLARNAHG